MASGKVAIGDVLDSEYEILAEIGSGGMGTVYRALQRSTSRQVAIKVVHPSLVTETRDQRFRQEAQALSRLNHGHIVTIYATGHEDNGGIYIAMELVDGQSVKQLVATQGPLPIDRCLTLVIQLAEALAYAHDQQIVHRDLKPSNILIRALLGQDDAKILDFGLAKILDSGEFDETQTGQVMGSPPFMSPEQWEQLRDIDGRTDIYSLGCVFYLLLTGQHPFLATSMLGYMRAHTQAAPGDPRSLRPELADHPQLTTILRACLARDRDARWATAAELLAALRALERAMHAGQEATLDLPAAATSAWADCLAATMTVDTESDLGLDGTQTRPRTDLDASDDAPAAPPAVATRATGLANSWALLAGMTVIGAALYFGLQASRPEPAAVVAPTPPAAQRVEVAATPPPPEAAPTPPATEEPEGAPAPAPAAAEEAKPASTVITVGSHPSGARVDVDGVRLGTTPCEVAVPRDATMRVRVSRSGYLSAQRVLDFEQAGELKGGELTFRLRRKPPVAAPTPARPQPEAPSKPEPASPGLELDRVRIE